MPTTTNLTNLTINHVESQAVYDAMVAQDKINENELYLIPGDISIATDNTPGGTANSNAVITSGAAYAGFQTKANKENAVYFVKGTQTASTNAWTGVLSAVNNLYDGLTIAYFLPKAGTSDNATLTLILGTNIETAAEPVYVTGTNRATTHYGAGSIIYLTWVSNATTGYSAVGSATGRWLRSDYWNSNTVPAAYCTTGATTAAKTATHTNYVLKANSYNLITIATSNTVQSALTLNINSTGAKPIYINGQPSSNTNYNLPAGTYLIFYDGTNYYFRTDGKITGSITGDAATLNGRSDYLTGNDVAPANPEPTASWGGSVALGTVANKEFKFTMPANPNTHYEAKMVTGANASGKTNASGGTNQAYLNIVENNTVRSSNKIVGGGTVSVASDTSGNITITGANPAIDISTQTNVAEWDEEVLVGKINNQEFKFTMPSNPDTNTTYSLTQDSTDGHKITLTPSPSGTPQTITIPDNNTNYYHQTGTWNGLTYSADNTNAPNIELEFTIPTGATADKVARGDHTHTFASLTSKPTTISGYGITNAYTKTEIDGKLSAVFHYKGTKATVGDLPTTGNTAGDVWHVDADGSEYVFTSGLLWEELGTAVDLSGYAQLSGANFTGPVNFGDSVTADDVTTGSLVVTGNASFTNNISANTINGVEVGSNPKFTDTTYTTTQSAKTNITISNHTTTSVGSASNWSAGSASNWVFEDVSCDDITAWSAGSFTRGTFAGGSGSFTQGSFNGGSGSFSASVSNHIMSFSHTHTAATHGADSHTHIAATHAADSFTAPSLTYSAKTASHVKSGGNGTAPSLTISSVTVTNGTSHTVTDNGHTHSI